MFIESRALIVFFENQMSFREDEILVEMTNNEIEDFRVHYKNLSNPEFIHIHLYLRNQLKWNLAMNEMTEEESDAISDRCKMKLYKNKYGKSEHKTFVGITGKNNHTLFFSSLDESLDEIRV